MTETRFFQRGYLPPEQILWQHVLIRVFLDAAGSMAGRSQWSEDGRMMRTQARAWLTSNSADFFLVCDFAGVEPAAVHAAGERLTREPEYAAHVVASLCGKINPRCFHFLAVLRKTDGLIDYHSG